MPISRYIFKNFLQNLEGKFMKSSSKSKALIHYPMGWSRRHCTPDLFISSCPHSMDPADSCRNPSWSSESFMHQNILCDLFHRIHGVQEMQVSVMMTHNAELLHRLLSVVLKLGLHGHHGSGERDVAHPKQCTALLMIHREIHTQSGWNALEHYFALIHVT